MRNVEIFQEPPRVRSLFVGKAIRRFRLPWVYFIKATCPGREYVEKYALCSQEKITDIYNLPTLYPFPFYAPDRNHSHIMANGQICFASNVDIQIEKGKISLPDAFWFSGFRVFPKWLRSGSGEKIIEAPLYSPLHHETANFIIHHYGDSNNIVVFKETPVVQRQDT